MTTPAQLELFAAPVAPPPVHTAPYAKDSATSRAAAVAIAPHVPALEARVLAAIADYAMCGGLTDEEGQRVTGISGDTYRPRRVWLQRRGLIMDTGKTRPTASGRPATVWGAV